MFYKWFQLLHAIPDQWKRIIKTTNDSRSNIVYLDHHLHFPHLNLYWKLIYLLPRILIKNTFLRAFQYKVLNNMLYLNHKLFQFRVTTTSLCSYCNQHDETVQNLFSTCSQVISLWTEIKLYFVNDFRFTDCHIQILMTDAS